jgi:hypothetical protein
MRLFPQTWVGGTTHYRFLPSRLLQTRVFYLVICVLSTWSDSAQGCSPYRWEETRPCPAKGTRTANRALGDSAAGLRPSTPRSRAQVTGGYAFLHRSRDTDAARQAVPSGRAPLRGACSRRFTSPQREFRHGHAGIPGRRPAFWSVLQLSFKLFDPPPKSPS